MEDAQPGAPIEQASSSEGDDPRVGVREVLLDEAALQSPEHRLALLGENGADRATRPLFDLLIDVEEREAGLGGEGTAEHRLASDHHAVEIDGAGNAHRASLA